MLPVLYDGWPLIYQPDSPAALHLAALLYACPPEVQPLVLLPDQPGGQLPERVRLQVHKTPNAPRARLQWEQRLLPRMASDLGARLLHLTTATAPLFTRQPSVLSPAEFGWPGARISPAGFWGRVREALSSGGMARLRGVIWPGDIPPPETANRVLPLAPGFPAGFLDGLAHASPEATPKAAAQDARGDLTHLDLPQTYILYHGPHDEASLRRLLDSWSWAAGPIGDYYPLLLLGLDQPGRQRLERLVKSYGLDESVRALPPLPTALVIDLYRASSALFHPAPMAPWGGSLRLALTLGLPVVALATARSDALVGPAAYLVPEGDARAMGAALVTVIVEESVTESLTGAALRRAADWEQGDIGPGLLSVYRACL